MMVSVFCISTWHYQLSNLLIAVARYVGQRVPNETAIEMWQLEQKFKA